MKYKTKPWAHLYKTALWKRLRLAQLTRDPLCVYCDAMGRVVMAGVVDHIKPHKGDEIKFYNPDNLQSMCKQHHDSTKSIEERRGVIVGGNTQGVPIDPNHHWNS